MNLATSSLVSRILSEVVSTDRTQCSHDLSPMASLFVQCTNQYRVDRYDASAHVIVSLAFGNVMDRITTIIVLFLMHLLLFVLIFDKLKTGPRPTLFSGEPLLQGDLF